MVCRFATANLGAFSRLRNLLDRLYRYLEFSRLVTAPHVSVETRDGVFFLEHSDLLLEVQILASLP